MADSFTYALQTDNADAPVQALVVTADFKQTASNGWQTLGLLDDPSAWLAAVHPQNKTLLWAKWPLQIKEAPAAARAIPSFDELVQLGVLNEQQTTEKLQRVTSKLTIDAKMLTGRVITVPNCNPDWTVYQVQAELEGLQCIPQEGSRLIHSGRLLQQHLSLREQGITAGRVTMHVVQRMRMGFMPQSWFVGPRPLSVG